MFWSEVIDMLRALIFSVAHVCNGSVGVAVILVSFTIRLALLPLTLRLARRARDHSRKLQALKPELDRLNKRYAKDPEALWRAMSRLYRRRGVKPFDSAGLLGGLAQAPIFAALYSTLRRGVGAGIRFLWIGDTSLPNLLLTLSVAALTGLLALGSPENTRGVQVVSAAVFAGITLWFLSSASALFALSTAAGSAVGALQMWMLRREERARSARRGDQRGTT
jgi:YidC/Oxa1 family membrane protein insertase